MWHINQDTPLKAGHAPATAIKTYPAVYNNVSFLKVSV